MFPILSLLLQIAPATSMPAAGEDLVRSVAKPVGGPGNVDAGRPAGGSVRRRTSSELPEAAERDSAEACRRQWFGRTMDYQRLVEAGRDPCGQSDGRPR